ncbi:hypothetical protein HDV00_012636 [Rhizophlyctis rosea]|nr:hypothetical protein HDV00_012636 [Rhizophlyctis rosea]
MTSKHLSADTIPVRLSVLASKPIPPKAVATRLAHFLNATTNSENEPAAVGLASADVTHQLTQLHTSLSWLVESDVESALTAQAGVGTDEVAVGISSATKPKPKKKKGGSKWA